MIRILYGVSPVGLGHATRAVAVGRCLVDSGADVLFLTGGPAAECLRGYGFNVECHVRGVAPGVKNGEMKNAVLWYYRYWRDFGRNRKWAMQRLDSWKPEVVVGDEEFSSVVAALERGVPQALITDELEVHFARTWLANKIEQRVSRWYNDLQRMVGLLIIPEAGKDSGNLRYVGPIVRKTTRTRDQVFREFGLPEGSVLVVVALSGTGIGSYLVEWTMKALTAVPGSVLVLMGNRGKKIAADRVYDLGVLRDGQDLVAAADVVVSTAGKSTIDEAACAGTPAIVIPVKNHSEQLGNASALGFSPEDLGRLPQIIATMVGKRREKQEFTGAQSAAKLILGLAR